MIQLWAFRLASVILPLVPRRIGCSAAGFLGRLGYYLAPAMRRAVEDNMRVVLGSGADQAKVRWAARSVFENAAKNYFELMSLPKLDMAQYGKLVRTIGAEHLENAHREGKGVIVISAHLGNFSVCAQEIAARSLDMAVLVEPLKPPEMLEMITGLRASKGVKWIVVGPAALRDVVKVLKRGGIVGIGCDRDIQKSGVKMPFFGATASLPQGAAYLSVRTGARLVPAFNERLADDTFLIHVDPALEIPRTGNLEADVQVHMEAIARTLEKRIGARPDQWVVFERIWPDFAKDSAS